MNELPEIVRIKNIAAFLGVTRTTASARVKRLGAQLPPWIEGAKVARWHKKDIEPYLHILDTSKEPGARVRVAFGKNFTC